MPSAAMIGLVCAICLTATAGQRVQENGPAWSAVALGGKLGDHLFFDRGNVVEIVLNRTSLGDDDLRQIGRLNQLTDLFLEATSIRNRGLSHLVKPKKRIWLNLYRTQISPEGIAQIRANLPECDVVWQSPQ
ncbi:MAG: hypothetical protein QF408_11790 [Pirellulales bacterium]|nr:hypothetical protein [Pirellulales bacterium]